MIELSFAELHGPWFFNKKSYGAKIEAGPTIKLFYDRAEKELVIKTQGKEAIVPTSNVVIMVPKVESPYAEAVIAPASLIAKGKIKAQVSDPVRDVVFGPGK